MLSNPANLQQRQRQHRRQQSTPTAFEAPKVPALPNIQRNVSHRRGMSLDQRPQRQSPPQDYNTVSNTNHGFLNIQQHILQEAQQQRLARPGQNQQALYLNLTNDENYLSSPIVSPQRQQFDPECLNSYGDSREPPSPYSPYSCQVNTITRVNPNECSESNIFGSSDSVMFPESGNTTPSAYLDFSMGFEDLPAQQDWSATIRANSRPSSTRRVSGGIADRVAKFEGMAVDQSDSRPVTPPNQNASNYFPPTPAQTPFNREQNVDVLPRRFLSSYDTSMEETLKPSRAKSKNRAKTIFQEMRDHAEMNVPPSPPGTAPIPTSCTFDTARIPKSNFMNMSNLNMEFMKHDVGYDSSFYSPTTSNLSPDLSQRSSPDITQMPLFGNAFENRPHLEAPENLCYLPTSSSALDLSHPRSPMSSSPIHRSASVDSINVEETITDTGITIDDIANYIEGPDPIDQKWLCLFPECKKRFGRKENIKSHVQTHLGDRQYQCPHCRKCFVRQHDLKRHAKIHSGVKPYPCLCGNSFARHDALTRHRQRGMCIGAFEGVVKKIVKRGRPRKNRPDAEERLEKATRTRSKNKAMSSASSTSGYSESSYGGSPPAELDILDDKPFANYQNDCFQRSAVMETSGFAYSPGTSMPADCVSPQAIQNAPSPSALSNNSRHNHRGSIGSIPEHRLPAHHASPPKSIHSPHHSQYNTPPELCLSSSSPPSNHKFYDISEHGDDLELRNLSDMQAANDEMFLNAFGGHGTMGMSRLEEDPDLLLLGGKFDDAFTVADGDDMFGDAGHDVFFGSP